MKHTTRLKQLLIGTLLGIIIAQPIQAQFAVSVVSDTSPTAIKGLIEQTKQSVAQMALVHTQDVSLAKQIAEYAEQANRWIQTANHYTSVIIGDAKRFTSLKGVMGITEQQLGLNEDTLKALADIGLAVRACYTVKNQFEALVHTRLRMLESIESRSRAGIFDPNSDLNDLEDYLRNSIGRSAQDVIATREHLAQFDNELERWTHDYELLQARKAALSVQLKETIRLLDAEAGRQASLRSVGANEDGSRMILHTDGTRVSASANAIDNLSRTRLEIEHQITEIDVQLSALLEKINERYKQYHQKFDQSKHTADNYRKTEEGWNRFMELKEDATIKVIDNYGRAQAPLGER